MKFDTGDWFYFWTGFALGVVIASEKLRGMIFQ